MRGGEELVSKSERRHTAGICNGIKKNKNKKEA